MPPPLTALDSVPDWVYAVGAFVTVVLGPTLAVAVHHFLQIRRAEIERRRAGLDLDQDSADWSIKHLRQLLKDHQSHARTEAENYEARLRQLHEEIREVRDSERRYYAESLRLADVVQRQDEMIKVLGTQVSELRAALNRQGIEVRSGEHTPLPPDPGNES